MSALSRININKFLLIFTISLAICIKCLSLSRETKLSLGYSQSSVLNFTEVTAKNLYRSEEHTVTTEDGYLLTVFRIVEARNCRRIEKPRPVLIMHGLLQNSDSFLDAGPTAGLPYLLSDACYDVWVGNQRGNDYGRKHVRLNPDRDAEFWQFSADEIGYYDLPATIDYVLKHTGADKVNYIGFSQGGGIFFMMCSERPDYCAKTALMVALAPAVFLHNGKSIPLRTTFKITVYLKRILDFFGIHELFRKGGLSQVFMEYVCQTGSSWTEALCGTAAYLDNYHANSLSFDTRRLIFSHILMGTSLNSLVRYGQVGHSGKFQKLDFGEKINLQHYNRTQAPDYNLGAATTPVVLIQGKNDNMVDFKDTKMLSTALPNLLEMVHVFDPRWTHLDMIYSQNIKTMIYPKIKEYLDIYSEYGVGVNETETRRNLENLR